MYPHYEGLANNEFNLKERTQIYATKVMAQNIERGNNYKDIKQIIMVNILDYELLEVEDYVLETAIVLDKHREYEVLEDIKWYFVELPKFRKENPNMKDKLNQWLAFIDDTDRRLVKMAEENNKTLKQARIEMNYLTGDVAIRRIAELREKWEMDRISAIDNAERKGREDGVKQRKARRIGRWNKTSCSKDAKRKSKYRNNNVSYRLNERRNRKIKINVPALRRTCQCRKGIAKKFIQGG